MAEKEQVSKQISVYKNNKALLETLNCLRPAPKTTPWHIHAAGKKEGYSLIRLVAVDYSKGKDSVSVYANLKPEEIKYIPESVNHLGEIFSENLKILCLWRYVFLQCFHPIVKKYLESYNPKTLAVIRFLAHFHLLGSRIQVYIYEAVLRV